MKRKNSTVKRKASSKSFSLKNPIIKEFYKKFKPIIYKNIKNNSFALAVSGGSDSLSLAYLSKLYSLEQKNKLHVLIVDHQLRKESKKESLKVKSILKRKKIESTILKWRGKVPKSNIQKNARNIRYNLISEYCFKNGIKYLVTAHHLDDQIENFFIRLFRGSGLTGLSSMPESFIFNNDLKIVRPFLGFKKKHRFVAKTKSE